MVQLRSEIIKHYIRLHLAVEITDGAPMDDTQGQDVVILPQKMTCLPQSYVFTKYAPWQEDVNRVLMDLLKGGFDQPFLYK